MAKDTWLKIDGTWKKVKNVWIKINGVWREKVIPKGKIAGIWKDFIQNILKLYENGIEYIAFPALLVNEAYVERTDNYICVTKISGYSAIHHGVISDIPIDLTNYKKLKIEWSGESGSQVPVLYFVGVRTQKSYTSPFVAYTRIQNITERRTDEVDISNLTGSYYIDVYMRTDSQYITSKMYIYKIWLE